MKLLKKSLIKGGAGEITVICEETEDMWHAYNLILPGDVVRAKTMRNVKREGNTGSVTSERVTFNMTIRVVESKFDADVNQIRVKGKNIEESKFVKLGQFHTIELEINRKFTLIKEEWDQIDLERLEDACNPAKTADLAAIVMHEGVAYIALVTKSLTLTQAKIEVSIPKKRPINKSQREKATARFHQQIMDALLRHVNFDVVKAILVASPGFYKDAFLDYLWHEAVRHDISVLLTNKSKFVPIHSSSGHLHDIQEVLSDPGVTERIADTKAAKEIRTLDRFMKMLNQDADRAFYGYNHVNHANELGAIDTLMVSDALFRSSNMAERRKYVQLVEDVRASGSEVLIFSSQHISGERLTQLTGVAAILRYPLPDVDLEIGLIADSSDSEED